MQADNHKAPPLLGEWGGGLRRRQRGKNSGENSIFSGVIFDFFTRFPIFQAVFSVRMCFAGFWRSGKYRLGGYIRWLG